MKNLIVILAVLFCATFARAQCGSVCRPIAYSSYTPYVVPTVIEHVTEILTPIAVPVLVPTTVFQYLPAMVPAPGVAATATVPQVNGNAPSVPQAPGAPDIDKIVRERVEAILREKYGANDEPPPLFLPGTPVATQPSDQDEIQQVAQLLATNCAKCHTNGVKISGDVTLFSKRADDKLDFRPTVAKKDILRVVQPGSNGAPPEMPPTAKKDASAALKSSDLDLLRRWAAKP